MMVKNSKVIVFVFVLTLVLTFPTMTIPAYATIEYEDEIGDYNSAYEVIQDASSGIYRYWKFKFISAGSSGGSEGAWAR